MNETLRNKCELFIKNRDLFKKAFPLEHDGLYAICASVLADKNKLAEVEELKSIKALIKNKVNIFSNFRGTFMLPLISILAVCDDPEKRLDSSIELYKTLKEHFFTSEYLPMAAVLLAGEIEREGYDEIAAKAKKIYRLMKDEHPFLTSSEDSIYAAIFAISEKSDAALLDEAEKCYDILKAKFHDRNALQSLSYVLALADDEMRTASEKCRDTIRLFDILKEKKSKYGTGYELSTLGTLIALPGGLDETARDLVEVSEFLKTQKGYGFLGFSRQQRLMHAAMIVTSDRIGGSESGSYAAMNGTVSMIAAQQAVICATIMLSIVAINASTAAR